MNLHSIRYGLTDSRRAINSLSNFVSCFPNTFGGWRLWTIILIILLSSSCKRKSEGGGLTAEKYRSLTASLDTVNKPKVDINVNRHYDSTGNLIGFDSTYTSFYSNVHFDTLRMDSLMNSFDNYFNHNHSFSLDRQFNNLFFNDTMRYPDFFHKDFFMKRYELNDLYMRDMMGEMDSMKNLFFYEHSKERRQSEDLKGD